MTSPFKFLDAYDRQDKEIFFGRSDEVAHLYQLVFQTHLLLVYGQSGTGKTSLIQCGLANRFKPGDWFEVFVRRKDDINLSLDRELRRHAKTRIKDTASVARAVGSLYLDYLRPIYLIFDQFEELFVLGTKEEQERFIQTIGALLQADLACTIIIVMREEYIAMLYDFERAVPALFNKRFRVEPMSRRNVQDVIVQTCNKVGVRLESGESTARHIIDSLSDHRAGVQLSYLQVYLDKLYRTAQREATGQSSPAVVFTEDLIRRTGGLGDVMADLLEEQTVSIQAEMRRRFATIPDDAVQRILETLVTLDGTKAPMTRAELAARLPSFSSFSGLLDACLAAFEAGRLVRHADGVYELAHDSLAGRIADKRSGERKSLLRIQKLVKDGYSGYQQTQTYLSRQELSFLNPYLAKLDSLDLTGEETAFVQKSVAKLRAARLKIVYGTAAVIVLLVSGLAYATFYRWKAERTIADASAVVGFVSRAGAALDEFAGTDDVRQELRETADDLNARLGLGDAEQPGRKFWQELSEADDLFRAAQHGGSGTASASTATLYADAAARFGAARDIALQQLQSNDGDRAWRRNLSIAHLSLGDLHKELGEVEKARASYTRAFELRQVLVRDFAGDTQLQNDLFESVSTLGDLEKADGDTQQGDPVSRKAYERARERYASALLIAQGAEDQDGIERHLDRLRIHQKLGQIEHAVGRLDDARAQQERAREIAERLAERHPGNLQVQRALFDTYSALGAIHVSGNNASAAADVYARSLTVAQAIASPHEWLMAIGYRNLGDMEREVGNRRRAGGDPGASASFGRARSWYAKFVDVAKRQAEAEPLSSDRQRQLALSYMTIGDFELFHASRNATAIEWYKNALVAAESVAKHEPRNIDVHLDVWTIFDNLGVAFDGLGNAVAGADAHEQRAREWFSKGVDAAKLVASTLR